jgi:chromosome partitioning protein
MRCNYNDPSSGRQSLAIRSSSLHIRYRQFGIADVLTQGINRDAATETQQKHEACHHDEPSIASRMPKSLALQTTKQGDFRKSQNHYIVSAQNQTRIVAMLGQKGGSGKSTIAVHLAVAAQQGGEHVAVIDTDPQATATSWIKSRTTKTPSVATAPPGEVESILGIAREQRITLVVIDTAPHADAGASKAIAEADLVIMPCQPTAFDVAGVVGAVRIAKAVNRPSVFVLNRCPPKVYEVAETREYLETLGYPVAPVTIGNRQAYARATASGEAVTEFDPNGLAAQEIKQLWKWVKEQLRAKKKQHSIVGREHLEARISVGAEAAEDGA